MTSGDCYYLQYTLAANHCQAFRLVNKGKEFIWNKVVKIETLPEEQVYDIEVEGTHNFIGNDIVAHNTYLTGGLGAGVAETTNGNITGTGRLAMTSTTATSTFSTGGLAVGTNQFVVQQNSGNVGIGTTGPGAIIGCEWKYEIDGFYRR